MNSLALFWWAPLRSRPLIVPQLKRHVPAWAALGIVGRRPFTNFGDELSVLVLRAATGRRVKWAPPERADVFGVGSILGYLQHIEDPPFVWGSGAPSNDLQLSTSGLARYPERILALRGEQTKQLFLPPDAPVVLGDPGLLASEVVTPVAARRRSGTVFVPHFHTWGTARGRNQLREARKSGIRVIPPSGRPAEVLASISRADHVLSSSLHGAVVAHALGVPVSLLRIEGGNERSFKYEDYYSSLNERASFSTIVDLFDDAERRVHREKAEAEVERVAPTVARLAESLVTAAKALP